MNNMTKFGLKEALRGRGADPYLWKNWEFKNARDVQTAWAGVQSAVKDMRVGLKYGWYKASEEWVAKSENAVNTISRKYFC